MAIFNELRRIFKRQKFNVILLRHIIGLPAGPGDPIDVVRHILEKTPINIAEHFNFEMITRSQCVQGCRPVEVTREVRQSCHAMNAEVDMDMAAIVQSTIIRENGVCQQCQGNALLIRSMHGSETQKYAVVNMGQPANIVGLRGGVPTEFFGTTWKLIGYTRYIPNMEHYVSHIWNGEHFLFVNDHTISHEQMEMKDVNMLIFERSE
ncbi:unnamed protein product [Caenorhabditis bovis]|uniref:Uncharacterized protein n=1 Tax=Caenorhabditis bovis TaxID=2654633 RepID=A0A8S1FB27_9PELO|nr:unnamed protein product [Caenorhabditis bovis]